jgi:AAHS family 4-hydroxybenzoate transporter-like MFS transporter
MSSPSEPIDVSTFVDNRPISRYQQGVFALCGALMFLDGFDTQMMSYVAPEIGREWGLSKIALGQIFSAALVGLMVGYLAISPLSSRFGHRRLILWSTACFGAATLLMLPASEVSHLIVLRFISGVGLGAMVPSALTTAGDYIPRRFRASSVLFVYCFFSLGFVAAGLASAWLIPHFGWQSMFLVGGVAPFLILPLVARYLPDSFGYLLERGPTDQAKARRIIQRIAPEIPDETPLITPEQERPIAFPLRELFKRGTALGTTLLWLVFALNLGQFYALQNWLPSVLTDFGYPLSQVVAATTLTTVGGIVIAFVAGPAMDRLGAYGTVAIIYLCGFCVLLLFAAALQGPVWLLLLSAFLSGCCVSGGQKSVIALAAVFYPAQLRSTGLGWGLGIGRLGGIGGPLAVGSLLQAGYSARTIFYFIGAPMILMAAAILVLRWRYKPASE